MDIIFKRAQMSAKAESEAQKGLEGVLETRS